jgi:hypothetical protein
VREIFDLHVIGFPSAYDPRYRDRFGESQPYESIEQFCKLGEGNFDRDAADPLSAGTLIHATNAAFLAKLRTRRSDDKRVAIWRRPPLWERNRDFDSEILVVKVSCRLLCISWEEFRIAWPQLMPGAGR